MKIQRYCFAYGDVHKDSGGNYYKRSDILHLLNPWKDAEKEKPEIRKMYFVEVLSSFTMEISNNVSLFSDMGWSLDYLNPEFKVIRYMEIPKNEEEE